MENPLKLLNFRGGTVLPIILQTELAECGLACLAMIGHYYGHKVDLASLRRRFPISLKGATLKSLMGTADRIELSSRALRLEMDNLAEVQTPAILHWDMNHFVVLKEANRQRIVIHDPALGARTLKREEVSQHFTGICLELRPAPGFKPKRERQQMRLRDFWQRITGIQRALVQLFILSLAPQLFALASPFYMQLVVDDALVSHDTNLLAVLALGFLLLTLIQIGTNALRSYVVMVLGNTLNIQMVSNLFRHLIRLPLSYFQSRHIGDVVSRFQSVSHVKDMFTTGMVEAFVDGLLVLSTLVLMFFYSPILGGIALAFAVLYLLVRWLTFHPFKRLTEETIVAKAKEQSNFMETVRGMQSVKLFNREVDRHTLWQNLYATVVNAGIRVAKFHIGFDTANKLLSGMENILVVYLGAKMVLDNTFTVGMLFAFMSYKRQFTDKTDGLVDKFIQFRMLELHFDRIADIAKTPEETDLMGNSLENQSLQGALELKGIAYRYTENDPYLFMNVNLQVKPGETLACLHHEIVAMPMGYNSLVGDMGTSLSGGQKQRILLARALYRQPKILFLDEATSHLDVQTERQVNAAIHQLDITRIIIAHRPETIRSANRVVALVNGQLQEVAPPIPA